MPRTKAVFIRLAGRLLRPWLRPRMQRFEQQAEIAYTAMYDARPPTAKDCYDDARLCLARAIDLAKRAGLAADTARLTSRRDEIIQVYNRQFRRIGYN